MARVETDGLGGETGVERRADERWRVCSGDCIREKGLRQESKGRGHPSVWSRTPAVPLRSASDRSDGAVGASVGGVGESNVGEVVPPTDGVSFARGYCVINGRLKAKRRFECRRRCPTFQNAACLLFSPKVSRTPAASRPAAAPCPTKAGCRQERSGASRIVRRVRVHRVGAGCGGRGHLERGAGYFADL